MWHVGRPVPTEPRYLADSSQVPCTRANCIASYLIPVFMARFIESPWLSRIAALAPPPALRFIGDTNSFGPVLSRFFGYRAMLQKFVRNLFRGRAYRARPRHESGLNAKLVTDTVVRNEDIRPILRTNVSRLDRFMIARSYSVEVWSLERFDWRLGSTNLPGR